MKHFYTLLAFVISACLTVSADTWTYDWPVSSTSDKPDYANGFYNFGSGFDGEITSKTRTLNGKS